LGEKIYRTKFNQNTFYLLTTIRDNSITTFVDSINDTELTVKLTERYNTTTKTLINLEKNNDLYVMYDYENNLVNLPFNLDNVREIYIEDLSGNYTFLDYNTFKITTNGNIELNNNSDYLLNHLYYLVNPTNIKDNIKLVISKEIIPYDIDISLNETINSGHINSGTYNYIVAYYDSY
jgi:polyphosphate kinase